MNKYKFPLNEISSCNKLIQKFYNLNSKISKLILSKRASVLEINLLLEKLKKLFKKLSNLRLKAGVKIATGTLALMLATTTLNAQNYTSSGTVQVNGVDLNVGYIASPVLEDIDNDGDLDLISGSHTGVVTVFPNDGQGVFTTGSNLKANGSDIDVGVYSVPVFADIDNDGDKDLYVGNGDGFIVIFTNNGSGVFSGAGLVQANSANLDVGEAAAPTFSDFDGDGDLDLFVGNSDGNIKGYLNNGSGVFSGGANFVADGVEIDVVSYAKPYFVDIDGDSDLDLIVGAYDGQLKVFIKNVSFYVSSDLMADNTTIDVGLFSSPTFVDIDADGDLDIFVGEYFGSISFYENLEINVSTPEFEEFDITLWPNPTKDLINISVPEKLQNYNAQVIDINGRIVMAFMNPKNRDIQIDLSKLDKGVYVLKIFNENIQKVSKIVIE